MVTMNVSTAAAIEERTRASYAFHSPAIRISLTAVATIFPSAQPGFKREPIT
jgi:hypothetical protein